jgi:membrane fusion protein, multidrug efflux system
MHGELPKSDTHQRVRPSRARRLMSWLFVLLAAGAALYYVFFLMGSPVQRTGRGRFAASDTAVPVLVAQAATADVPVTIAAVGTTQALNTVTVRSQVDGKLLSVDFKEGQDVKKGDILARIDPTTFKATLDQAKAKKAQDEAQLANAKLDLERYERLAAANAINKQQADTQRALVAQNTALVQSDTASVESAQATLGYTDIRAPLDGRTGLRQVDPGNIIHASDAGGVVVITQMKPIAIVFTIPQQDVQRVNEAFAKAPLQADALRPDSNQVVETGKLTVVDNQVDASTGTVKLKAEFPNSNLSLWPGQFVNVRLTVDTLKGVTVVPTSAVQRGPNGTFVYVVSNDNKTQMRTITVQKQDENQTVIASGVSPGDRVVTTGFVQLTYGKAVTIGSDNAESAAGQAAAPQSGAPGAPGERGQGRRGDGQRGQRGDGGGRRGPAGAQ